LIESFERSNICDTEVEETLIADGKLAGIVSRTVRPSPAWSSTTPTGIADEGAGAGRVAIVGRVPNGAMCGQQSCWC
jgi:hypothetical protein